VMAAHERNIPCVLREELLQEIIRGYRTIGIAGTHGKGTVASMIAWVLEEAGWKPGFIIGGVIKNFEVSARESEGRWMVVELDDVEACDDVLKLDYVVCNFLEADHLAVEAGLDDLIHSMQRFLEGNERLKEAFINLDCTGNRRLVEHVALRPTGYGLEHFAEFRGEVKSMAGAIPCISVHHREKIMGPIELSIPGDYNLVNALAAFAVTRRMGVDQAVICNALRTYRGVADRFDISHSGGVAVIKDGAREASKIRRVLASARVLAAESLVAVMDFIPVGNEDVFEPCSKVVMVGQSQASGREEFEQNIKDLEGPELIFVADEQELKRLLLDGLIPGDAVVFLGSQDGFEPAESVGAELAQRSARAQPGPRQERMDGPLTEG
ncbi:MAG: Mur ligase family protein, partial [Bradymonadaceae bacterium]